jgi:predicted nucleotidyltransferase
MVLPQNRTRSARKERIDVSYDYAVCAWARHFNVSEKRVKEAVAAVGDDAEQLRAHLKGGASSSDRPSAR